MVWNCPSKGFPQSHNFWHYGWLIISLLLNGQIPIVDDKTLDFSWFNPFFFYSGFSTSMIGSWFIFEFFVLTYCHEHVLLILAEKEEHQILWFSPFFGIMKSLGHIHILPIFACDPCLWWLTPNRWPMLDHFPNFFDGPDLYFRIFRVMTSS
jgi:hypothetical protein